MFTNSIAKQNIKAIKKHISDGNLDYKRDLLLYVLKYNRSLVAHYLLLNYDDIDVNQYDAAGLTPLHLAIINGDNTSVSLILGYNTSKQHKNNASISPKVLTVDVNAKTIKHGETPLMVACTQNNVFAATRLLDLDTVAINEQNDFGFTALMLCKKYEPNAIVQKFLEKRNTDLDLFAENIHSHNTIHCAFMFWHKNQFNLFLHKNRTIKSMNIDFTPMFDILLNQDNKDTLIRVIKYLSDQNNLMRNFIRANKNILSNKNSSSSSSSTVIVGEKRKNTDEMEERPLYKQFKKTKFFDDKKKE